MKRIAILALVLMYALSACGASGNATVTLKENETWNVEITNCPAGNTTTLIIANDGAGPAGVFIRGISEILKVGDEIIREVDCGNGTQKFALGKISNINTSDFTTTIEIYDNPVEK